MDDKKMGNIKETIEAVSQGFIKSFNKGDLEKAMSVYSYDATILPPNFEMMKGLDNISGYWKAGLDMGIKEAQLETMEVTQIDDTYAYELGKYILKIEPGNGQTITDRGKYLMIWKKVDGKWKWYSDAWNSSLPPA